MQSTSSWRKVQVRLEGEPAFEAMDPLRRLEVFQEHVKCAPAASPASFSGSGQESLQTAACA